MANLTGDSHVSLRVSLLAEECSQCHGVSETFVEPCGVCATCWSILVLNKAVNGIKKAF